MTIRELIKELLDAAGDLDGPVLAVLTSPGNDPDTDYETITAHPNGWGVTIYIS
jgi:hypothetical protein